MRLGFWPFRSFVKSFIQPRYCVCGFRLLSHAHQSRKVNQGRIEREGEQSHTNYPLVRTICVIKSIYAHDSHIKSNYTKPHIVKTESLWTVDCRLCSDQIFCCTYTQAKQRKISWTKRWTNLTTITLSPSHAHISDDETFLARIHLTMYEKERKYINLLLLSLKCPSKTCVLFCVCRFFNALTDMSIFIWSTCTSFRSVACASLLI